MDLHGGQLTIAQRQFPNVNHPWIDLSTGINPYAYPIPSLPSNTWLSLPEQEQELYLKEIAALYYGVQHYQYIAVAPGTQILISLMPYIFSAVSVCILSPTYMEYEISWKNAGVPIHKVFSIDEFMTYAKQPNVIGVCCNPNNPDGRLFQKTEMISLLEEWSKNGNHLIVDEAFMDFEGESIADYLPHPYLTILRSFGKTFGLAGVRLGFLLSSSSYAQKVREMFGPWSVNGPALYVAALALQDKEWFSKTYESLCKHTKRLDQLMIKNGFSLVGGTSLFRLIQTESAYNLWERLCHQGILTRKFDYNPHWLRLGIPNRIDVLARLERVIMV